MSNVIRNIDVFTEYIRGEIPHSERGSLFETLHLSFENFQGVLDRVIGERLSNTLVLSDCRGNARGSGETGAEVSPEVNGVESSGSFRDALRRGFS